MNEQTYDDTQDSEWFYDEDGSEDEDDDEIDRVLKRYTELKLDMSPNAFRIHYQNVKDVFFLLGKHFPFLERHPVYTAQVHDFLTQRPITQAIHNYIAERIAEDEGLPEKAEFDDSEYWIGKYDNLPNNWWKNEVFLDNLYGTDPYSTWGRLSQAEKDLIKDFPNAAHKIYKNRPIAEQAAIARFGRNGRNDKSDAFRHAYFNALNSKDVGAFKAELFSTAHESETPLHLLLEKQMDLFNNNIGHHSTIDHPNKSDTELADIFYQKMLDGELRYLSPLGPIAPPNNGINSNTKLTPTNK